MCVLYVFYVCALIGLIYKRTCVFWLCACVLGVSLLCFMCVVYVVYVSSL